MDHENVYVVRDLIVTSSHRNPSVRAVSLPVKYGLDSRPYCLAPDFAGQLLIICGKFLESVYKSVHKLFVGNNGDYKWEKFKSSDGYALFVDEHQSFSLPASDDDHNNGVIIANRIYYTGGVSNLEFDCFGRIFADRCEGMKRGPFWFLPMTRDVIGEHMKSEKGVGTRNSKSNVFSYWTVDEFYKEELVADSKVSVDEDMKKNTNRFQALLSTEDDVDTVGTSG
ncbi:hypothetical protein LINGRAHAP2_LOCUS13181 [Linum grandiflorum]